ncbi:PREDICTED: protein PF14_0175-like [Papilio xuthus]|uniref:Protein PF14_0175-like n=1 Tax=Papilio xuthus TaxID=66420 RepID=A0AAJ6ZAA4_PAPXU|nr:PREDICTED: protein PF14_0175-like [Papilio xuthus]
MDRSHSRSASPREPARPQHRPPSPPSPPAAFDNRAYEHDDYDPNHNDFDSTGPNQNGHTKEVNGDTKTLEAVNLELINLTPKNGTTKQRKDVEVDMNTSNPYDEYFVPVNEHRKYMRGEKLYVTADKRGEKGGCKRPLCWTLLGLVVATIVALIVLAATGILFTNSPTPLEPYNASVSSARALGGISNAMSNEHSHEHDRDHESDQGQDENHSHVHGHDHGNNEQNSESEQYGENDQTTEHGNNQDQDNSQEDMSRENQEILRTQYRTTPPSLDQGPQMQNDDSIDPSSASEETGDKSVYVPRTLEGELKIDNDDFTAALEDPESDGYRDFANAFGHALKQVLFNKNSKINKLEYNENDIALEIVKIRRGSIIVTYRIHWDPKYNTQTSDNLLTPNTLKESLDMYLAQNNRMISIYHIAEDEMATRRILDICQINKNGCDYGCQFDKRTLDFTCTCPPGQIIDMKQPKKCMLLFDNQDQINNNFTSDMSMATVNPNSEDANSNTEIIYSKQTAPPLSETTTENDSDVNFSHIFGSSLNENDKHVTEIHHPEEHNNIATQYISFLETTQQPSTENTMMDNSKNNEPVAEPEPTSEPQHEVKTTVASDSFDRTTLNKDMQPNPTLIPEFARSSEPQPTPEPTTETFVYQTTENAHFIESNKMKNNKDLSDNENLSTTETSSFTHHSHMHDNKFHITTLIPSEIDTTQPEMLSEKYVQETTTENEWLEDSSEKVSKGDKSSTEQVTYERSSKSYESIDETSRGPTTLQDTDKEIESYTKSGMNEGDHSTNAVSISQFLGKKPGEETTVNSLLDTTVSVLTGIEESRHFFNNDTTENNINGETTPSQISLFGITTGSTMYERADATTPAFDTSTEYSIAKQTKDVNILDPNFMTILKNTNNSQFDNNMNLNVTTEKDFAEGDITFDAINKLYNRSSKSFVNDKESVAIGTEANDMFKETTETTTSADWLSETVTEINYQDIIDENKNKLTTEASATRLDEIMSRGSNKDDFEPDYLNMGSNTTKNIEHDMPQYGMLHDYDNDDLVVKRVKNAPGSMIEETTAMNVVQIASKENQMDELTPIPTVETNDTFETTTVSDYIYKMMNTSNENLNSAVSTTQPVPQVWENSEDDMNFIRNLATSMITDAVSDITTTLATTTQDNIDKSNNENMINISESNMQSSNVSQANNLNVNIYEISNLPDNHTTQHSVNHQPTEFVDHETEMNPFLPEIENNKSLVKKLQEGHDLEPSNVNETQNETTEDQLHRVSDENIAVNNQTDSNGTTPAMTENTSLKAEDNEAILKEMLMHQDISSNEEKSQTSLGDSNKDTETTTSVDPIVDDVKDLSGRNDAVPLTTFLLDTDDLDTTKDPFEKETVKSGLVGNYDTTMMSISLPETTAATTDNKIKINDDNDILSVVPIEPEVINGQDNLKKNYDGENLAELNQISDSPKKSDRRTVDSDNTNSLIYNEA